MNEETKDRLLRLWQQTVDKGTWSIFGGVFTVDNERWQVVPMGGTWENGTYVVKAPRFLKCS